MLTLTESYWEHIHHCRVCDSSDDTICADGKAILGAAFDKVTAGGPIGFDVRGVDEDDQIVLSEPRPIYPIAS